VEAKGTEAKAGARHRGKGTEAKAGGKGTEAKAGAFAYTKKKSSMIEFQLCGAGYSNR
jgi:hypothetical protein